VARIAVQIGHYPEEGAAYEVATLLKIFPNVVNRLKASGHQVDTYDGSLAYKPAQHQYGGDGCVFLHCDSGGTSSTGYSIGFWEDEHPGSGRLAAVLKDVYGKASGLRFIGYNITVGEWHYYGNRRFNHSTKCTLIECGFVSNPNERAFLQANAQKLGYAIADAYTQFFGGAQPQPEPEPEEDTMIVYPVDFKEVEMQGEQHVYVASEGWWDLPAYRANCYLIIKNESEKDATNVEVFTTPFGPGLKIANIPKNTNPASRYAVDMVKYAPKGGFATTVKSKVPIVPQLVIWGDKK